MPEELSRKAKLRDAFLVFGAQYFAHARYSSQEFYLPVSATLFHHAIEMLLKGYLSATKSSDYMKRLGHELTDLWKDFKADVGDPGLARFDSTIQELDKVELLRYPDSIVDDGYVLHVSLSQPAAPIDLPGLELVPQYYVRVSDLDAIAAEVFKACGVPPEPHFQSAPTELLKALPPSLWGRDHDDA